MENLVYPLDSAFKLGREYNCSQWKHASKAGNMVCNNEGARRKRRFLAIYCLTAYLIKALWALQSHAEVTVPSLLENY